MIVNPYLLATLIALLAAGLTLLTTAALYWAPTYDSRPPEAAPRNPLALLAFWWYDVLWALGVRPKNSNSSS